MNRAARHAGAGSGVRAATSRDGYVFDPLDSRWKLSKDVSVSPDLPAEVDAAVRKGFRMTLQRYAEEKSALHTWNMMMRLRRFFRDTRASHITPAALMNWRAVLGEADQWELGALRGFFYAWFDYGYEGVSREVVDLLAGWRLKGNEKGGAVAGGCPYKGPLTDLEMAAILDAANTSVVRGQISFEAYAYVLTLAMTARRPVQIAALRGRDVLRDESVGRRASLRVPRAKQRGGKFRAEFRTLPILEDLFVVLEQQWKRSVARVESAIGTRLAETLASEVPIFCNEKALRELTVGMDIRHYVNDAAPDKLHIEAARLARFLKAFEAVSTAKSERTGGSIHINATRFRYTRGTKLRREGFGPFVIAEVLDHSDVQNVRVYAENTAQEAVVIDKLVGAQLAPYAQACLGTLVNSETEAIRGNDPKSRIANGRQNGVGTCGNYGFCASGYKACYTCYHFQPWVDGPHEEVLADLYAEKARAQKAGCSTVVVEANDQLILAVEHCVALCHEARRSVGRDEVEVLHG